MIYYKATRPDGTDFHTGTVDYAGALDSGEPLPLLTSKRGYYRCCTETVYHAADVPAETLVGGSWPCRLFEVEGEPVDQMDRKFGFRTLTVVREIEAWKALGPNGEAVVSLIERASRLTKAEVEALAATWDAKRDAARDAALDAALYAARYAARYAALDAARYAARYATRDAALALVVKDLLSEEHFNTLYGPFGSVIDGKDN